MSTVINCTFSVIVKYLFPIILHILEDHDDDDDDEDESFDGQNYI